jgi:signal transduction histidine kinase
VAWTRSDELRRILGNLVDNARRHATAEVLMSARSDGGRVLVRVDDDGPGIPPDDRERIFEKFTRLGDHLTRPQQGVGLGLYIARRSIEEMGGEIWCDESPTGGARFGFSLPVHHAPARSATRRTRTLRA